VKARSQDELGRLATTFNSMCASLQAARAELIRQERISTIGRLASSIVHDLRNPLAAIYGGAEMLVDTEPNPERTRRLATNIYRASRRIQELLQDLTNVTRGSSGKTEPCNLRDLIMSGIEPLRSNAESQNVTLAVDVAEDLELDAERGRLEGVFLNLVDNALAVLPKGGEIHVSAKTQPGSVVVEVADNGPGISREIRAQLFQPFVSHGKKNGLGLGLALARQTVLDHGGDLWVNSEEGRGARFFVRLPLVGQAFSLSAAP
jgi:signal transduction histidine kinase